MQRECPNCHLPLNAPAMNCPRCGYPLQSSSASGHITPGLGKPINAAGNFSPRPFTPSQSPNSASSGRGNRYTPLIITIVVCTLLLISVALTALYFFVLKENKSCVSAFDDYIDEENVSVSARLAVTEAECPIHLATSKYGTYYASNLIDGNTATCWSYTATDVSGDTKGVQGPVMTVIADRIDNIHIWNGYQKSNSIFYKNMRARGITIYNADGSPYGAPRSEDILYTGDLADVWGMQTLRVRPQYRQCRGPQHIGILLDSDAFSHYKGSKYTDLCISEIEFYGEQH